MELKQDYVGEFSSSSFTEDPQVKMDIEELAEITPRQGNEDVEVDSAEAQSRFRKQLMQYEKRNLNLSCDEWEDAFINLMQLFLKATEKMEGEEITTGLEKFASEVSQEMVSAIQEKLFSKPAEEAQFALKQFLQWKEEVKLNKGWLLLKSIFILSSGNSVITSVITESGIPTILIKSLYLFAALPSQDENIQNTSVSSFQDLLTKTILQLCRSLNCVEEMVQTRELQCLIIAMTSLWDQCCASWRDSASLVLRAISKAQAINTVKVLKDTNCIKICIQNLLKIINEVPAITLAQVAVSVFSFVKDSYSMSPWLLTEFEHNDGYKVLQAILFRCDTQMNESNGKNIVDLLDFIASLTICGQSELKVAVCITSPQPTGFQFNPITTTGSTVKNLSAYRILQTTFHQSENQYLCTEILSSIKKIWTWAKTNFFLLEWTLQSFSQLADCVYLKPTTVYSSFFDLLETVVFEFSYIPHETLKNVQNSIQEKCSLSFNCAALDSFCKLTMHNMLFIDIFSDSGLLELLLLELRKEAKVLRKAGVTDNKDILNNDGLSKELTCKMLNVVAALVLRSVKNVVFLRDKGMVPYIKIFLDDQLFRNSTLCILEQLSVVNPEEYMSTVIGALCTATEGELHLKRDLLQSLLLVLETPKGWCAFRTAGGFNGLLSLIMDMEGALSVHPSGLWATVDPEKTLHLILLTFQTIATAIHLDLANNYYFKVTDQYEKMAEALRLLGCFSQNENWSSNNSLPSGRTFFQFVGIAANRKGSVDQMPLCLQHCVKLLYCLDKISRGIYQNVTEISEISEETVNGLDVRLDDYDSQHNTKSDLARYRKNTVELRHGQSGDLIYHPGAIHVIMTLIPLISCKEDTELAKDLQCAVADRVQSIVKSERNRQIMCESGLLETILTHCQMALCNPADPFHLSVTRIFEKLASQAIGHNLLRQFLRIGDPLKCATGKQIQMGSSIKKDCESSTFVTHAPLEEMRPKLQHKESVNDLKSKSVFSLLSVLDNSPTDVQRMISLVSITSPRNFTMQKIASPPSFIEFDMSTNGYGCLFLPSLATVKGVNSDSVATGGHGIDCRAFPPATGLSFSIWFMVGKFSSISDAHPVRLFTVIRHMSRMSFHYVCLSVSISAPDNILVISTEEEIFQYLDMMEPDTSHSSSTPSCIRLMCSKLLTPDQWHHLTIVIAKDVKRTCKLTAYLNGNILGESKMQYIQPFPGQSVSMDPTSVTDVHGIIGTPLIWRKVSSLSWRLGPAYLFDEAISQETVKAIDKLGPNYIGNFQAVIYSENGNIESSPCRLIMEEKISFGLHAASSTVTNVTSIKNSFNEVDSRLIAQELGISSRDNATPVYLAKNLALHLSGTSRTIGAALVGDFGVRSFVSQTAANSFLFVGGPAVILGFVAIASDDSSMYTAMKILLSVITTSPAFEREMSRIQGYKILAFLLKFKSPLLSNRIFQLILSVAGTMELGCGSVAIQNYKAFEHVLCDFEIWKTAPDNLEYAVLTHFDDLLKSTSDGTRNAEIMHQLNLMEKLIFLLNEPNITCAKVKLIIDIMKQLLQRQFNIKDILRIGLFLISTLLPTSLNENVIFPENVYNVQKQALSETPARTIWMRNQLLEMLLDFVSSNNSGISLKDKENMFMALGSDWFLLFLQSHLHSTTILLAIQLLLCFLNNPNIKNKFQEGMAAGTWLENIIKELGKPVDPLKGYPAFTEQTICISPGFKVLQSLLCHHIHISQIYYLLAASFLGKITFEISSEQVNLDSVLESLIESIDEKEKVCLCVNMAVVLFGMVKAILSKSDTGTEESWENLCPGSIMKFFCLIHNIFPRDKLWSTPRFLEALADTIFPCSSQQVYLASSGQVSSVLSEDSCNQETVSIDYSHPGRKQVCNFMRILLMDSLINITAQKQHPYEVILEFFPEKTTQEQICSYQTEILEFVMDIIRMTCQEEGKTTHLIREDDKKSIYKQQGKIAILIENVALFSKKLVEKLYTEMFSTEPQNILIFITEQIVVVTEKAYSQRETLISILYNSLNRVILYFLSRSRQSLSDLQMLVNTLKVLQEQWDIIFATYNSNVNFITCLMHCLIQIKSGNDPDGFGWKVNKKNAKRFLFNFLPNKNVDTNIASEIPDAFAVQSELLYLLECTWNKVLSERRHTLEDTYKIDLSVKQGHTATGVSISEITPLWEETANKAWQQFVASQKKKLSKSKVPQLQSGRINAVSNTISTAMRTAYRKFDKESEGDMQVFLSCLDYYRKTGQDMFTTHFKCHMQKLQCDNGRSSTKWMMLENQLLHERGVFGPDKGVFLPLAWVLDPSEGPPHMRRKLRRYNPENVQQEGKTEHSTFCRGFYLKFNPVEETRGLTEGTGLISGQDMRQDVDENGLECNQLTFFPSLNEIFPSGDFSEQCTETQVILQELSEFEQINIKLSVAILKAHVIAEGVLMFGKADFYICENFTLSDSNDVFCKIHHPSSVRNSFICSLFNKAVPGETPTCCRYPFHEIKEIHYRRFLHQDNALEIFMTSGHSLFLVFQNKDQIAAFKRFCSAVPSLKGKGVTEAIINVRKHTMVEKTALQSWQKGELSNFEYIMYLNTSAGRTYNDLMQYPVFPWIIADYDSETLDLSNPKTFRDLSKPMGAQTEERRAKFIERYNEVENNDGDLSAQCLYCTHYSSAIIVASFLVRMEPFSKTFLALQGGSFDVADRMFHSVKKEWESASRDNMSDVRELIPEFFYLPDFLMNSNRLEFGCMQDGTSLGDVILPPWAKGDPTEFIRMHREALECDHVSAHLHEWIDLIFGYKQQGQAAVEALNCFHPYFYGEQQDLDNMDNPLKKNTVLGFISNFGQIPRQLFTKPHPPRTAVQKSNSGKETTSGFSPIGQAQPFFFNNLKPSAQPLKELFKGPVGQIVCGEKDMLVVEKNKLLIPPLWNTTFSWGFNDLSCAFGNYGVEKNFAISECLADWGHCLCAVCPSESTIVTAGTGSVVCIWDTLFGKDKLKHMKLRQVLYGHTDSVTCLAVSLTYSVIISGSLDRTCIIWDFYRLSYITQLPEHNAGLSAVAINDLTGDIASCAGGYLYLWNSKGQLIASINTSCEPEGEISCCCFAQKFEWDCYNIIVTGCADGIVRLWKTEYVKTQLQAHHEQPLSPGHSAAITPEKSETKGDQVNFLLHSHSVPGVCIIRGKSWERHLVLCRELNRSQVVSLRRYRNNPAITAVTMSRNCSVLLVGDAWGRVFSWSVDV
ncbi:WD repeat- and FYVE domain-containing protein 4 isoform X2 [Polypterus senegalus]|uniref:WD repeat- and FYVE domain-containing protein 4 isoform X2 n=1 Tax=Polypterus senegalus TaxID=55291 RepID=UPI001966927C|nr:WD repeat- and FYVE domain-containing protein 4 isoform X2 [Polypterus senegalus]